MAKLQRNFIKGRMNKSLDERLVPNGEYIDALNVRVGSTELSEVGVIENSKGNTKLTTLDLVAKDRITFQLTSYPLSSDAKCIGAYEDSANETIYWFVTDPSHTGPQVTNKLDLIVSYDVNDSTVTYHVVSVDDGGGVNTSLNFNSDYLITGVDKVDDLLFFTDNFNQPRMINVTREYPTPGYVGGLPTEPYLDAFGAPTFFAESLLVIKKPPVTSPTFELTNTGAEENFLKDRFICFAYRYRYEDDMYSAVSQFTNVAFVPNGFNYDPSSYLNEGMVNLFDTALITINSGSKLVVGIDLLFKEASNPVIRVIEKLDKQDLGIGNNQSYSYQFSNNKIYTILDDNEILRLYDNVPLKAKAQTIMGSRLVYGNYLEGYDVDETQLQYGLDYVSGDIGVLNLNTSLISSQYDILATGLSPLKPQSAFIVNFSNIVSSSGPGLKTGSRIDISITFGHGSFELTGLSSFITQTVAQSLNFSYVLNQDFNSVQDLFSSQDFIEKIGVNNTVKPVSTSCTGITLTDIINCSIPTNKVDSNLNVYTKLGSGISQPIPVQGVLDPGVYTGTVPSLSFGTNEIAIQLPASYYVEDGFPSNKVAEYYEILNISAQFQSITQTSSLHSDRDYEVGIIYMDEFNRSTTVLVSPTNIVHVPCSSSDKINILKVTIPSVQLPPNWAKRYKLAIKQDKEIYETIYSDFYFEDPTSGYSYILLEGENAQKVESGDVLKIKRDASAILDTCVTVTVLEKEAKERDFIQPPLTTVNGNDFYIPSGVYMKLKVSSFSLSDIFQFTNRRVKFELAQLSYPYNFPRVLVPVNFTGTDSNPVFFDESLLFGDTVRLEFTFDRPGEDGVLYTCTRRKYEFDQTYTVSQNYNSFKNWWEGDNIPFTLGNGQQTIGPFQTQINLFVDPAFPTPYFLFPYIDILANAPDDVPQGNIRRSYFRFYEDLGKKYLIVQSGSQVCKPGAKSEVDVRITITKGAKVFIFETQPQDAAPNIWYESPVSYPITNGFHTGNVQDQTTSLSAIINTEFENCFAFGNGAESYKIRDSITRSSFGLGNRTSSVLKGQEFKQVLRFADLTYSGIYNYNILMSLI
jgi:hypothetical protein